jgi:hypothetical protein
LSPAHPIQVLLLDNNNYMHRAHQLPWSGLTALTHLSLSSCANLMGRRLQLSQLVGLQRLGAADNDRAPVGASLEGCTALKVSQGLDSNMDGKPFMLQLCRFFARHINSVMRSLVFPGAAGWPVLPPQSVLFTFSSVYRFV